MAPRHQLDGVENELKQAGKTVSKEWVSEQRTLPQSNLRSLLLKYRAAQSERAELSRERNQMARLSTNLPNLTAPEPIDTEGRRRIPILQNHFITYRQLSPLPDRNEWVDGPSNGQQRQNIKPLLSVPSPIWQHPTTVAPPQVLRWVNQPSRMQRVFYRIQSKAESVRVKRNIESVFTANLEMLSKVAPELRIEMRTAFDELRDLIKKEDDLYSRDLLHKYTHAQDDDDDDDNHGKEEARHVFDHEILKHFHERRIAHSITLAYFEHIAARTEARGQLPPRQKTHPWPPRTNFKFADGCSEREAYLQALRAELESWQDLYLGVGAAYKKVDAYQRKIVPLINTWAGKKVVHFDHDIDDWVDLRKHRCNEEKEDGAARAEEDTGQETEHEKWADA